MRIGIDIDGVLTDSEKYQFDVGSKYFYEKFGKRMTNHNGYNVMDAFDITEEEDDIFWGYILRDYATNEKARKYASEVIQKLKNEGHEIYIVTARCHGLNTSGITKKEMMHIVAKWMLDNEIIYDKIIYTGESKVEDCIEHKIDCMIEDKPSNIYQLSEHIPVICFHAGYNTEVSGKQISRAYSWYEVYQEIQSLMLSK